MNNRDYLEMTIGPLVAQALKEGYTDVFISPDRVFARVGDLIKPLDDPDLPPSFDPSKLRDLALVLLTEGVPHLFDKPKTVAAENLVAEQPLFTGDEDDIVDLRTRPDETRYEYNFDGRAEELLDKRGSVDLGYDFKTGRVRIKVFLAGGNTNMVIRLIPKDPGTFEQLGLPSKELQMLPVMGSGLFVVTGPTGSGKTTTIASILQYINKNLPKAILTVEDPIEFVIPPIRSAIIQREVGRDTPSFKQALEDSLRQNPDVIVIGEVRDPDTLIDAIRIAASGHLVIISFHAGTPDTAISRIVNTIPDSFRNEARNLLASVLLGVLAQSLLPRASGPGRVLAYEYLPMSKAARTHIREGRFEQLLNDPGRITFKSVADALYGRKVIDNATYQAFLAKIQGAR